MKPYSPFAVRQVSRYARESLFNEIALCGDSIAAYRAKSYGTGYFLATIAMEEVGKFYVANQVIYQITTELYPMRDMEKQLRLSFNHRMKQTRFAMQTIPKIAADFVFSVLGKDLETKKQRALYVDIELSHSKGYLSVGTPKSTTEAKCRRQISNVHTGILDAIKGAVEEYYIYQIPSMVPPLDRGTLDQVKGMWASKYRFPRTRYYDELLRKSKASTGA